MKLMDTPAGFDEPLAALSACHRRIEKQMATLARLQVHVTHSGVDDDARIAASSILRYFVEAAQHHHADEEIDLFPKILRAAEDVADRAHAFELVSHLLVEHRELEAAWELLRTALEALLAGKNAELNSQFCNEFTRLYSAHIEREECDLLPLAARLLPQADLVSLGNAMAARRGLAPPVFAT